MISYINTSLIVILIVLVVVAILYLKKKNDGDVYNKSDHEGFKSDIIKDIEAKIDQVKENLNDTLTTISKVSSAHFRKSGVKISIVVPGLCFRTALIVWAK